MTRRTATAITQMPITANREYVVVELAPPDDASDTRVVGASVGTLVGVTVGLLDGAIVGVTVGLLDGRVVGL
jgi:hypothetical protein